MLAMCFAGAHQPLVATDRPIPEPGPRQLLIRVRACGVCRTDLHVVDGELPIAVLEALLPVDAALTEQLYCRSIVVL